MTLDNHHLKLTVPDEEGDLTDYFFVMPDPRQLVRQDRAPFTQRVSNGAASLSTLEDYGNLEQRSFHNGAGFVDLLDLSGYRVSSGLDPRHAGFVTIWPQSEATTITGLSPLDIPDQIVPFSSCTRFSTNNNRIYLAGEGGVWDYNVATGQLNRMTWPNALTTERSVIEMFGEPPLLVGLDNNEVMLCFTAGLGDLEQWTAATAYSLGDIRYPTSWTGYLYECTTAGTSAGSAPAWPTSEGATVADNTAVWTTRLYWRRVNSEVSWRASTAYSGGVIVRPTTPTGFYYQANATGQSHGVTEPTWPTTVGNTVVDNQITWTCRQRDAWAASETYVRGDRVRPSTPNNYEYEVLKITDDGISGTAEPTWPTTAGATITDGEVTWITRAKVAWAVATTYGVGDLRRPTTDTAFYYEVTVSTGGTSGASEPTWPTTDEATVVDNTVTWVAHRDQSAPVNAGVFAIHDGYIFFNQHFYTGSDDRLVGSLLHLFSEPDGEDAEGFISTLETHPLYREGGDPGAVQVGRPYGRVRKLISYGDTLFALLSDGLYKVALESTGNYVAYRLDIGGYDKQVSRENFVIGLSWEGAMWFNVRNRLIRYTGQPLADLTPPAVDHTVYPNARPKELHGAVGVGRWLYVLGDSYLWCVNRDGSAWHRLQRLAVSGTPLTVVQGSLFFQPANTTEGDVAHLCAVVYNGTTTYLLRWPFDEDYDYPSADATYTSGTLDTSWIDLGFIRIPKAWHQVVVRASFYNIPASTADNATVKVYALLDSDYYDFEPITEVLLGTLSSPEVESDYTEDVGVFDFPVDAWGYKVSLRFELTAGESSGGDTIQVALRSYALVYILRPPTVWGRTVTLILADNMFMRDGRRNKLTGREMYEVLERARDSVPAIAYEDLIHNKTGRVHLASIRFGPVHKNSADSEDYEFGAFMSLVDVPTAPEEE